MCVVSNEATSDRGGCERRRELIASITKLATARARRTGGLTENRVFILLSWSRFLGDTPASLLKAFESHGLSDSAKDVLDHVRDLENAPIGFLIRLDVDLHEEAAIYNAIRS